MGRPLSYLATLETDVVKGIGPARARKLRSAGIRSVADLLLHVPRRYLDRSQLFDIAGVPLGEEVTVGGEVLGVEQRRLSRRRLMTTAHIGDGTSILKAIWFNPYVKVSEGADVALSGKVERFRGSLQMKGPDIERLDRPGESLVTGRVVPIHPTAGGMSTYQMRQAIDNALRRSRPVEEILPEDLLSRHDLVDRDTALTAIHFPTDVAETVSARRRLVFDELLRLQLGLAVRKHRQIAAATGIEHDTHGPLLPAFVAALAFPLTAAQQRAIDEIRTDMSTPHPMHRLLQGEVGSGKTVVAFAALLTAVQGGHQGAVMAPTEVLAEQHYHGMAGLVDAAGMTPVKMDGTAAEGQDSLFAGDRPAGPSVRVALLTGANALANFAPGAPRGAITRWIGDGDVDIVVGTHALIQEGLDFHRLGIAVVDEQHRFGVGQRVRLKEKASGPEPDVLIMTATPIPRTLSMTLYGDLDVSVLDEMPPGRSPVATRHVTGTDADMEPVYAMIRDQVGKGRQAFIVCPLVEDSDKLEVSSATAEHARLGGVFPELAVGLLHGRMGSDEKEAVMRSLRSGELDVLVATTVIEVGIDVPNATVMVVEDADRFGLSQLHQLRGRVGRGTHPATCILVADPATEEGERRITAMVRTNDGFELAEEDLRIRGQGAVFGERQAGVSDLKLADVLADHEELIAARREAFALVAADPDLSGHPGLVEEIVNLLGEDAVDWLFKS